MLQILTHKKTITSFCSCLCLILSFAQQATLTGIVKGNPDPLPNATVSINNKTVKTNNAGEFSVSISPGTYTITVTHVGYKKHVQSIALHAGQTLSFTFDLIRDELNSEEVILGSRSAIKRSNLTTPVPEDFIHSRNFPASQLDVNQILVRTIPSFNSPPQTQGITQTTPATLRGVGPDQTLVLLNGKRRHNNALIWTIESSSGVGTVGTDLNAIPSAAIESITVLRDGGSAQYGSDAIAGVINIQLKKSTGKTSFNIYAGQYYKGDGETFAVSLNRGIILRSRKNLSNENRQGYLNFTISSRFSNYTQRNGEYTDMVYYNQRTPAYKKLDSIKIAERGFNRKNQRPIGNPQTLNAALVVNGGYPLNERIKTYWTGTLNNRIVKDRTSGGYRYPKDSLLYVNTALFPDGFHPKAQSNILDFSVIAGIEGTTNKCWNWDFSSTYGGNIYHINLHNSNNATQFDLGKNAPTDFFIGALQFTQNTNNLNFTKDFSKKIATIQSLTVSFGGEFRIDHFRLKKGEEASYENYSIGSTTRYSGSQNIQGYKPQDEANKKRHVSAAYGEVEMDLNKKFLCNLAGRYEYYNDFGGNLAGKLAMRYKFADAFMLRGAINNGFRAPGLQQIYASSSAQVQELGIFYRTVLYKNDGEVARAFGVSPLEAEKSVNASLGITSKISNNISITLDAYWLKINQRVVLSGNIRDTIPEVRKILNDLKQWDVKSIRFVSNAINTKTKGLDLNFNSRWPVKKSLLEISLAVNYNRTSLYGVIQTAKNIPDNEKYRDLLFDRSQQGRVEKGQPRNKAILTINYSTRKWKFNTSHIRYGKIAQLFADTTNFSDEFFSSKIVSAFSIRYLLVRG